MERYKFPRTPHFDWSPGFSGDDERLADVSQFEGMDIVITEKLDGENTTIYSDGYIHARLMSGTSHPWQAWVKREMAPAAQDLPRGWRLCGENLYGIHSIEYSKLPSFFFIFAIIDDQNIDLAWDEIEEFAGLLDVPTVPVIYKGPWDEELVKNLTLQESRFGKDVEGYVMRNAKRFSMNDYGRNVAKYVRKGHIQTDEHWTKNWKPAKLGDLE